MKIRLLIIVCVLICVCGAFGEELTYIDLIGRLTDLEQLALLPEPGEKCAQWSSYDRASKYDANADKYVGWEANGDRDGCIRKEGDNIVMAQMAGPGVIWRIWSALAESGHVKIYLDSAEEPAVDLPFIGYFDRRNEPFTRPALVHKTARGQNCYVPISYQKSCKVVAEPGWGGYYHFTYTTYPKGTKLPTFKRELSREQSKALDRANDILSNCGRAPAGKRQGQETLVKEVVVAPGRTATIAQFKGRRAITALKVKMDLPESPAQRDLLRELVLGIYWDNDTELSVWTPLGDFFGTAPGVNKYRSLPLGMTDEGFYSYWYMPFEKGALLQLTNNGSEQRKVVFEITHSPVKADVSRLGRFHAKWHRDVFPPAEEERRRIDWTMLKTEGAGRFCGVMLHVWNPAGGWWGEGDEKFFVDGEKFPSTYGTGSEDYFGYAWCTPELFSNCYHNQTISMNNRGHVSVNRWHITDNIPFTKSFEGCIEKYWKNSKPTLYAAVAYWYLDPEGVDPYEVVPKQERLGYYLLPTAAPETDVADGVFVQKGRVVLTCRTKGAKIRYTLDTSEPTESSSLYTAPIAIDKTTVIKAKAFKKGHAPSPTGVIKRRLVKTYRKPENPSRTASGLSYKYYEGAWYSLPNFAKLESVRTGTIERFVVPADVRKVEFGLLFEGYIEVPQDGIYNFYLSSDDGSQFYVGGHKLIDNDRRHRMTTKAGQVALGAGKHRIGVIYFQYEEARGLRLEYSGPGIEKRQVGPDVLFH